MLTQIKAVGWAPIGKEQRIGRVYVRVCVNGERDGEALSYLPSLAWGDKFI